MVTGGPDDPLPGAFNLPERGADDFATFRKGEVGLRLQVSLFGNANIMIEPKPSSDLPHKLACVWLETQPFDVSISSDVTSVASGDLPTIVASPQVLARASGNGATSRLRRNETG